MLHNNWLALAVTFLLALAWLRFMDLLAHKGLVKSRLSRKIIHVGTGPIFVLCWLLFTDTPEARYLAALIPLAITIQFGAVGLGLIKDDEAVSGMSRSGDRREILRGPLFYGIVFVLITLLFWKQPVGIVALMMLCGGDGIADLTGQLQPRIAIPWSPKKSVLGSLGVLMGGILLSILVLAAFIGMGIIKTSMTGYLLPITLIGLAVMLVESLPFADIDNLTVPLVAVLLGIILF